MDLRVSVARERASTRPPNQAIHISSLPHWFSLTSTVRMDTRSVYTIGTYYPDELYHGPDTRGQTQKALMNFILEFHIDNTFIYR